MGRLVNYGRTKYRPPVALADHVIARDRTYRGVHCSRQASSCDLDHHHEWRYGGETNDENLGPVCRGTHVTRHSSGWRVERRDNGDHEWHTPLGRTYRKRAATYPIDRTASARRVQSSRDV